MTMTRHLQKAGLLAGLRSAEADLQTHYARATDGWQASELRHARDVVQDAIKYLTTTRKAR